MVALIIEESEEENQTESLTTRHARDIAYQVLLHSGSASFQASKCPAAGSPELLILRTYIGSLRLRLSKGCPSTAGTKRTAAKDSGKRNPASAVLAANRRPHQTRPTHLGPRGSSCLSSNRKRGRHAKLGKWTVLR